MTLTEVMVAIFIVSLLGMLAGGITYNVVRTHEDMSILHERYHTARLALTRMKRELTMAFVSLHQAEDKRTETLFEGEDDRIVFNTRAHEPLRRDARQSDQIEVEYYLDTVENEDGDRVKALMRRVKFHIDDRPGKGGRADVVVEGVEDLEFEYFDELADDWRDEWDVRVDDAEDMRARLKEVQAIRDKLEDIAEDEETGVAGVAAAAQGEELVNEAQTDALEGLLLPTRIRITLTLVDNNDIERITETMVEIPMVEPLWY